MAITLDDIQSSLKQAGVEDKKIREVLENLNAIVQEQKDDKESEKGPKSKNQFIAYVMDDGSLTGKDLVGFVVQVAEDVPVSSVKDRIYDAARSFNGTRKGRKFPATTMGDLFENVKGKHWKDEKGSKVTVKTKHPIQIIPVPNAIPEPTKRLIQAD